MNFKIEKGSQLFDDLMVIKDKVKISKDAQKALCKEIGSDGNSCDHFSHVTGDINAFHFNYGTQPAPVENWRHLGGNNSAWWWPRYGKFEKLNKDILQKIKDIPRVSIAEVQEIFKSNTEMYVGDGGMSLATFSVPGIKWYQDYILCVTPDKVKFNPPEGMVEILTSEYLELEKQEALTF